MSARPTRSPSDRLPPRNTRALSRCVRPTAQPRERPTVCRLSGITAGLAARPGSIAAPGVWHDARPSSVGSDQPGHLVIAPRPRDDPRDGDRVPGPAPRGVEAGCGGRQPRHRSQNRDEAQHTEYQHRHGTETRHDGEQAGQGEADGSASRVNRVRHRWAWDHCADRTPAGAPRRGRWRATGVSRRAASALSPGPTSRRRHRR